MIALTIFWLSSILIIYTYLIFPVLVLLRGVIWHSPPNSNKLFQLPSVSVIIAAYNEAGIIADKLDNILALDYPRECLEVVIASDGSNDGTNEIVKSYKEYGIKLLPISRQGKAKALNNAVSASTGEILVFSDANSMYKSDAIQALVKPFADPNVGGVAGNQVYLTNGPGSSSSSGERAYWNLDRVLKIFQSKSGNTLAATGAIYAIRRSLFRPIPDGVADDFVTSTSVIAQGYRLLFAQNALAYEPVVPTNRGEFRRKVRVIVRSWRAFIVMRKLLNPFQHGFYAIQFLSHKIMRYLVVFPLMIMFFDSLFLWNTGLIYQMAIIAQIVFYSFGMLGYILDGTRLGQRKVLTIPFYFCMVNLASFIAIINILQGRQIKYWEPQRVRDSK